MVCDQIRQRNTNSLLPLNISRFILTTETPALSDKTPIFENFSVISLIGASCRWLYYGSSADKYEKPLLCCLMAQQGCGSLLYLICISVLWRLDQIQKYTLFETFLDTWHTYILESTALDHDYARVTASVSPTYMFTYAVHSILSRKEDSSHGCLCLVLRS